MFLIDLITWIYYITVCLFRPPCFVLSVANIWGQFKCSVAPVAKMYSFWQKLNTTVRFLLYPFQMQEIRIQHTTLFRILIADAYTSYQHEGQMFSLSVYVKYVEAIIKL